MSPAAKFFLAWIILGAILVALVLLVRPVQ